MAKKEKIKIPTKSRGYKFQKHNLGSHESQKFNKEQNTHKKARKKKKSPSISKLSHKLLDPFLEDNKASPFSIKDKFFLLERFVLKQRIEYIKEIENQKNVDYNHIAIDFLLKNLFLKKFRLDPGFRLTIYKELNEKSEYLRKITREILKFFEDKVIFTKFSEIKSKQREDYDLYLSEIKFNLINERRLNYFFNTVFRESEQKNIWVYRIWRKFMEQGKIQEAVAVESMLLEFISGYNQGYFLFWGSSPYKENRKAQYYLLNATREVIKNIKPYFLDYIEAERKNITLCDDLQFTVDNLKYPHLHSKISEYLEHFQDLIKEKLTFIDISFIRSKIMNIAAYIYFNFLNVQDKIDYLNKFYGVEPLCEFLNSNPNLYEKKDFISDLPIWHKYDLLSEIKGLIEKLIKESNNEIFVEVPNYSDENINNLILIKYLCKTYINIEDYANALEILILKYPFLQNLKIKLKEKKEELKSMLNHQNRILIELLFLFGEISSKMRDNENVDFTIEIFNLLVETEENIYFKVKLEVIKSIIYRFNKNFQQEKETINKLNFNRDELFKNKLINPFEVLHYLMPLNSLFSEDYDEERRIKKTLFEFETLEVFEREPLIPSLYESYLFYFDIRKFILNNFQSIDDYLEKEFFYFLKRKGNQILFIQLMASFEKAIEISKTIEFSTEWTIDRKFLGLTMEIIAFPYFYNQDYKSASKYLKNALFFRPNDLYYCNYLVLINLILGKISDACSNLLRIYEEESNGGYLKINSIIKSCFQNLRIWFEGEEFNRRINDLFKDLKINELHNEKKSKIYCDIGLAIADLGYFRDAIKYFYKAFRITKKIEFKGSILNNIGTIYGDIQEIEKAIPIFEQAISLSPNNSIFRTNLARMYELKLNFIRAQEIYDEAYKYFKDIDMEIALYMKAKRDFMDIQISGIINLNIVHDKDALKHFILANDLIKNLKNFNSLNDNTGIIFLELTNGFASLFHSKISLYFLDELYKIYPPNSRIPKNEWIRLPRGIKEIWKGDYMTLGSINYLLKDILNPKQDPFILRLKKLLLSIISKPDIEEIQYFTFLSSPIRNPGSHGPIIDNKAFMENITEIFKSLNKTLVIFDKIQPIVN